MLAMTLYPEVQAEAHAELDRVMGSERLPDFEDRPNLPYLECVVQESYRWHTAVPIGTAQLFFNATALSILLD